MRRLLMSNDSLIKTSLLLFIDQIVVLAAGGWFFWLLISKMTSPSVVGQATAVYSLVNLVSVLATVGLEYPLLKRSLKDRSQILGTAFAIQIIATGLSIPVVLYMLYNIYYDSADLVSVALLILVSWPVLLTTRFALLGISNARIVLFVDSIGTPLKFIAAYILLSLNLGSAAILISIMIFNLFLAAAGLLFTTRFYGFTLSKAKDLYTIFREGVINIPTILSKTLIFTLSIVLLASLGIGDTEIGTFYIVLMISLFAGGLVTSNAYMLIPHSSASKTDLSLMSARISISLTVPIIAVLISAPKFVLSIIGEQYIAGEQLLLSLSIGIVPFSIVTLGISKLNYLGRSKTIVLIGLLQLGSLLIPFFILTPQYGTLGSGYSIIISYLLTSIPIIVLSERLLLRYLMNCAIALATSWSISFLLTMSLHTGNVLDSLLPMSLSFISSLLLILALRNISLTEIKVLISQLGGRSFSAKEREIT
jgi:O-antigen/teichoic acid export membrane protein